MEKLKIMTIFGTRPDAIKMAPLVKALEAQPQVEPLVCVTAQHRQMLDQVLNIFDIQPDYDLNIMQDRQTLEQITTRALEGLSSVLEKARPDMVLVHGDTTTCFVASLAAFYKHISIGHVEAGLRTFDKYSPYPEEMNRRLAGVLCDLHFAPTANNRSNLLREGVSPEKIFVTGNTAIDALKTTVRQDYRFTVDKLNHINFSNKKIIAVTAHRRENLGEPLRNICTALKHLVETYPDVEVVYSVHLNPVVQETAASILGGIPQVHLISPPLDAQDMHNLMARSYMIMTDSGGLQEEGPSLGKPLLVLRKETERPEALSAGTVKLAGTDPEQIHALAKELLTNPSAYDQMARAVNPYGDGSASRRIVDAILFEFGLSAERPAEFLPGKC